MKHLIDKEKFLKEALKLAHPSDGSLNFDLVDLEQLLSKHTKDLPKKKLHSTHRNSKGFLTSQARGAKNYNQCLEDCEGK